MLIPAQFGVDIFREIDRLISRKYELIIFQGILNELEKFSQKSTKTKKEAQITLELAKKCTIIKIDPNIITASQVDEKILQLSVESGIIVATNDRELRKKLRAQLTPVIFLRKKAYLAIEGEIPI